MILFYIKKIALYIYYLVNRLTRFIIDLFLYWNMNTFNHVF